MFSEVFSVCKGVRQGGILSAYFFAVYMDDLCDLLVKSGLGCRAGSTVCNHLVYADDIALLATSIRSMKALLNICDKYGQEHDLTFNPTKTFLQAFVPHDMTLLQPIIRFRGSIIQWTETVKYLGYEINCHQRDEKELNKRKREMYMQANLVRSRFQSCSYSVKKYLFNTYFGNVYCNSLWCPKDKKLLDKVKVAYNDSFRIIFGYSRRCSASAMFAENSVRNFEALRRNSITSLIGQLCSSTNSILLQILNSDILAGSTLYTSWCELIFKGQDLRQVFKDLSDNSISIN